MFGEKWKTEGEFTLYNGPTEDEQKFYEYFRKYYTLLMF